MSFPLAKETAALQAADLLVHLTYLHMGEVVAGEPFTESRSKLLLGALANKRSSEDHRYQDREKLAQHIAQAREHIPVWRAQ